MSYGGKTGLGSALSVFGGYGLSPYSVPTAFHADSYARSGSSRNSPFLKNRKVNKRATYRVVKEYFVQPVTKRFANPAYPDKSKKKFVYYTQNVKRYRIVKIPVPARNAPADQVLFANDLNFWKTKTSVFGAGVVSINPVPGESYSPNWSRTISGSLGLLSSFPPSGWGTGSPSVFQPLSYPAANLVSSYNSVVSRLRDSATRKIYSKAKDQHVNLQNFMAELSQTKGALLSIFSRLVETILLLRKGRLTAAARHLLPGSSKDLANDVLLYKFGIAPLISDMDGVLKHLAQNSKDQICTIKAVSSEMVKSSSSGVVSSSILSKREDLSIETEITVKCVLSYKVDLPAIKQLSQLGFTNQASTAWELVPWSFVIDWFFSIGDYLDSLDSLSALTPVSFHTTTVIRQKVTCISRYGGIAGSGNYKTLTSENSGYWTTENVAVSRQVTAVPPMPIPVFKNPFSVSHLISAAALLVQLKS